MIGPFTETMWVKLDDAAASAAVPEPGQVAASLLLLAGLGGYIAMKRRKTPKAAAEALA